MRELLSFVLSEKKKEFFFPPICFPFLFFPCSFFWSVKRSRFFSFGMVLFWLFIWMIYYLFFPFPWWRRFVCAILFGCSDHFARSAGTVGEAADQSAGRPALCPARLFHTGKNDLHSHIYWLTADFALSIIFNFDANAASTICPFHFLL